MNPAPPSMIDASFRGLAVNEIDFPPLWQALNERELDVAPRVPARWNRQRETRE
jgi:hypothetical protein